MSEGGLQMELLSNAPPLVTYLVVALSIMGGATLLLGALLLNPSRDDTQRGGDIR
jgi:hypothetical protein